MTKCDTIHDRIQILVDKYGNGKNTVFAEKVGVSEGNIRGYIKGIVPKHDFLEKVVSSCEEISPTWLLTGKGSMLLTDSTVPPEAPAQATVSQASVSYDPQQGKPYYDVDFLGGFNELFNCQTSTPACNIIVPGFDNAKVWCNVTGHSMEPKITHGDIIALRPCSINDIQYGEIYAVVLDTFRTIKVIRRGSSPDTLLFVPINTPEYEPQEFPTSRILHIFEVIGSISRFF